MKFCISNLKAKDFFVYLTLLKKLTVIGPFQPSVAFHMEASHLICCTDHMTGVYKMRFTLYILHESQKVVRNIGCILKYLFFNLFLKHLKQHLGKRRILWFTL